jgi:hypothetical protein
VEEKKLKAKLKELDDQLAVLAAEIEDMQYDAEALLKKRRAFARRNCDHVRTRQRSVMGKEIITYCDICDEEL